ncbi:MAG TPA: hypothetical protein VMN38_05295, partial [Sphingomicrobium sp.]|nr:hypothetical protein [Sphingomicrobium sp.]
MTTSHRRIALLAGASLAALGLSAPALAAPHDTLPDGVYPGDDTTVDTVEICDIAGVDPCFYGVIDTVDPALAVVTSTANGQIYQHDTAATVDLL